SGKFSIVPTEKYRTDGRTAHKTKKSRSKRVINGDIGTLVTGKPRWLILCRTNTGSPDTACSPICYLFFLSTLATSRCPYDLQILSCPNGGGHHRSRLDFPIGREQRL